MHYPIAIVGSGPAAHTAAIYAARANLKPVLFEGLMAGGVAPGGQLTTTTEIENFPGFPGGISGPKLMELMREQSTSFGTEIFTETVTEVIKRDGHFIVQTDDRSVSASAVIISTGATAKRLGIDGEKEYWQRGISACAVCDGALPIFRDQELVVIGGGDTAAEEALFLTKYASKVTLLVRRDEMRASKVMQDRVFANEKIDVLWNTQAQKANGDERQLRSLTIVTDGVEKELPCGGLFYAIGHKPNTDFLDGLVELDDKGYIITEPGSTVTSVAGVFAAGDVQDSVFRQAVTSAGTGCMAALEAERFIEANHNVLTHA